MSPPKWSTESGRRLSLNEFGHRFSAAWSRTERRFLKVECWQTYQELDFNRSQEAYEQGDIDHAREFLRMEAESDGPLYADIKNRGIDYARIRLVQEPLTPYLRYELLAYQIRASMGESIEIVRCGADLRLPGDRYFDYLIFDRHTALIHDYGETGLQSGGWLIENAAVLAALERQAVELRRTAIPFEHFLAKK